MSRRNMRTLTLKEAAARTRLSVERIRQAVVAGHIQAFRQPTGEGAHTRGAFFLLEASFEAWFFSHVTGGADATPDPDVEAAVAAAVDVNQQLLDETPPEDRFV